MSVLDEVKAERRRQDEQWGGPQNDDQHTSNLWALLLMKHLGKLATARVDEDIAETRRKAITVAALCVAMVEAMDRRSIG